MVEQPENPGQVIPQATVQPDNRTSWLWIVPLAALLVAGWLGATAWSRRGLTVTVEFQNGYGLDPGDDVRYHGSHVGRVRRVDVTDDLRSVRVELVLDSEAQTIARAGARFWIVRPQLGAGGVAGLETIVGPRYLAVLPGRGEPQRQFVGLEQAPIVQSTDPGDLEIILYCPNRGGLNPGARVTYRQVAIGTIMSVGLTSDAGAVEARVHIPKAYAQLVRVNTAFWNVGGVEADIGFRGVTIQMESLQSVITGGIAMATPTDAGEPVRTGHRFRLAAGPPSGVKDWRPSLLVGSDYLPPGEPSPVPRRAVVAWRAGRWIKSQQSRGGWVLAVGRYLAGPADLITPQATDGEQRYELEVAGERITLPDKPVWDAEGVAAIDVGWSRRSWPASRVRPLKNAEDCVLIADPTAPPLPVAASRLRADGDRWRIDPAVAVDHAWHGACAVSRNDGYVVGIVVDDDDQFFVAPLRLP